MEHAQGIQSSKITIRKSYTGSTSNASSRGQGDFKAAMPAWLFKKFGTILSTCHVSRMYKGKRVLCFRRGSPTPHVHARAFIYPPRVTGGIGRCRGIGGHRDRPAAYPLGMHDGSMFQVSVTEPITKAIKIETTRKNTPDTASRL